MNVYAEQRCGWVDEAIDDVAEALELRREFGVFHGDVHRDVEFDWDGGVKRDVEFETNQQLGARREGEVDVGLELPKWPHVDECGDGERDVAGGCDEGGLVDRYVEVDGERLVERDVGFDVRGLELLHDVAQFDDVGAGKAFDADGGGAKFGAPEEGEGAKQYEDKD